MWVVRRDPCGRCTTVCATVFGHERPDDLSPGDGHHGDFGVVQGHDLIVNPCAARWIVTVTDIWQEVFS
jgi:hypothetical protein